MKKFRDTLIGIMSTGILFTALDTAIAAEGETDIVDTAIAAQVVTMTSATSVNGQTIAISLSGSNVMVDEATVAAAPFFWRSSRLPAR
jgi:hypothetical protein